jgi:hypothetical protein
MKKNRFGVIPKAARALSASAESAFLRSGTGETALPFFKKMGAEAKKLR